jgi:hypothetical protein
MKQNLGSKFSVLTRFLHENRCRPADQVRGHASLENALAKLMGQIAKKEGRALAAFPIARGCPIFLI